MWMALKALPWLHKIGIAVGLILALAAFGFGMKHIGYVEGANLSKVEISRYETKVKDLQTKLVTAQGKVTIRVVTEYQDRIQTLEKVVYKNRDVIINRVPEQYFLSQGYIYAYNQSVMGLPIDPEKASNPERSPFSDARSLLTITDNNGVCLANGEQLKALQQWINEQEKARQEVVK